MSLKLELFHKNVFHNKIRCLHMILSNSFSIIDVHVVPKRKQHNFYYNIKQKYTENNTKFSEPQFISNQILILYKSY